MTAEQRERTTALHLSPGEKAAWEGFLRTHARLMRELDAELTQQERLPLSSYDVLIQLARAPRRQMRMSELAEAVLLSPSGLTRLVERLEREGLVTRVKTSDDGRGACATLTEHGRQRLRRATRTHLASVRERFLDRLSEKEQRLLAEIWERTLATPSAKAASG